MSTHDGLPASSSASLLHPRPSAPSQGQALSSSPALKALQGVHGHHTFPSLREARSEQKGKKKERDMEHPLLALHFYFYFYFSFFFFFAVVGRCRGSTLIAKIKHRHRQTSKHINDETRDGAPLSPTPVSLSPSPAPS